MTPRSRISPTRFRPRAAFLAAARDMHAAGAVAGRAEGLPHRALRADQHVGVAPHVARDEDRLSHGRGTPPARPGARRRTRASRPCGARRASRCRRRPRVLELGDVVADVVDAGSQPSSRGARPSTRSNAPLGERHHHLPVGPGEVRRRGHRAEVALALARADRRAGELAVGQLGCRMSRHRLAHDREGVVAHLVAEAARAGVDRAP